MYADRSDDGQFHTGCEHAGAEYVWILIKRIVHVNVAGNFSFIINYGAACSSIGCAHRQIISKFADVRN